VFGQETFRRELYGGKATQSVNVSQQAGAMCAYVLLGEHKLLSLRFHCTHECLFFSVRTQPDMELRLSSAFNEEKISRLWASISPNNFQQQPTMWSKV
jgi:hypothetical protein